MPPANIEALCRRRHSLLLFQILLFFEKRAFTGIVNGLTLSLKADARSGHTNRKITIVQQRCRQSPRTVQTSRLYTPQAQVQAEAHTQAPNDSVTEWIRAMMNNLVQSQSSPPPPQPQLHLQLQTPTPTPTPTFTQAQLKPSTCNPLSLQDVTVVSDEGHNYATSSNSSLGDMSSPNPSSHEQMWKTRYETFITPMAMPWCP